MNELRRHAAPLVERWQRLARGQRVAVIAVVIACAVGFSSLIGRDTAEWQPICNGRQFSANELSAIQKAWREHGLQTFRRDGHSLSVPKAEASRYEAALPKLKSTNADTGTEWEKQLARTNFFTTSEQLEQHKDNALRNELRRVLKAIPTIADVDVIWARSKTRSAFGGRPKVTASINILPRDGHDLTPELAQSLRLAVARMVPDLSEADIAVLDQSTGLTMTDASDQLVSSQQRHRQHERLTKQIESKLLSALAHIPGAAVEVHWTLAESNVTKTESPDSLRHFTAKPVLGQCLVDWHNDEPSKLIDLSTILDDETTTASPLATESVASPACQIAVRIPQTYLDAHFAKHWLTQRRPSNSDNTDTRSFDELCSTECSRLKQILHNLLPTEVSPTALTVVAHHDSAPTSESNAITPFAAWPHVAGTSIAVLCILAAMRPRQRREVRRTATSNRETVNDAPPIAEQTLDSRATIAAFEEPIVTPPLTANTSSLSTFDDLARLQQLDPERLAEILRQERPQAVAVLLTRFPTRLASACLSRFPSSLQTEVIRRLKSLTEVSDEVVAEIARGVCQRIASPTEPLPLEPTNRIAHLLPEAPTPRVFA